MPVQVSVSRFLREMPPHLFSAQTWFLEHSIKCKCPGLGWDRIGLGPGRGEGGEGGSRKRNPDVLSVSKTREFSPTLLGTFDSSCSATWVSLPCRGC